MSLLKEKCRQTSSAGSVLRGGKACPACHENQECIGNAAICFRGILSLAAKRGNLFKVCSASFLSLMDHRQIAAVEERLPRNDRQTNRFVGLFLLAYYRRCRGYPLIPASSTVKYIVPISTFPIHRILLLASSFEPLPLPHLLINTSSNHHNTTSPKHHILKSANHHIPNHHIITSPNQQITILNLQHQIHLK